MNKPKETKPAKVPETAKQAGETLCKWSWVEPEVWTERMLAALEKGVKGGKWGHPTKRKFPYAKDFVAVGIGPGPHVC